MSGTILVVEDDLNMAQVLRQGLEQENYLVTVAHTGTRGLELAQAGGFDGIVLDILLPALDGRAVARRLRAGGVTTPILMLTALDSVTDLVAGFDAGAEDYLTKPFSFLELLARLRSLVQRGKPSARTFTVGDLFLDSGSRSVARAGKPIHLTKTEYLLLEVLIRNAGHVVSRGEIVDAVWNSRSAIEQNSIDVYIKVLRAKLDQNQTHKMIETVRGFGYRLVAQESLA